MWSFATLELADETNYIVCIPFLKNSYISGLLLVHGDGDHNDFEIVTRKDIDLIVENIDPASATTEDLYYVSKINSYEVIRNNSLYRNYNDYIINYRISHNIELDDQIDLRTRQLTSEVQSFESEDVIVIYPDGTSYTFTSVTVINTTIIKHEIPCPNTGVFIVRDDEDDDGDEGPPPGGSVKDDISTPVLIVDEACKNAISSELMDELTKEFESYFFCDPSINLETIICQIYQDKVSEQEEENNVGLAGVDIKADIIIEPNDFIEALEGYSYLHQNDIDNLLEGEITSNMENFIQLSDCLNDDVLSDILANFMVFGEPGNPCEQELILEYPYAAFKIFVHSKIANNMTQERFGGQGLDFHLDCADAFRHTFFNALNSRQVGKDIAKLFSDAHECNGNDNDAKMDYYNNAIGNHIGQVFPNVNASILADRVCDSLEEGLLKILQDEDDSNSNLIWSSSCSCN